MPKTLILAGGGHAHMTVMAEADAFTARGHRVILVSPDPYHYYSGMGPGLLGGAYRPPQIRFHVRKMVEDRGGSFVCDRVVRIDAPAQKVILAGGETLTYDILSCNTGSGVLLPPGGEGRPDIFPVKPIAHLVALRRQLAELPAGARLLVVGGGPAGTEVAANLAVAAPQAQVTLALGHHGLLPPFPAGMRRKAESLLAKRGVDLLPRRIIAFDGSLACDDAGERHPFDRAIVATGVVPCRLYRESGLATGPDGALAVNAQLQAESAPKIFGGGDCIHFTPQPLAKVGVYAVRQNPVLRHNLLAALEGEPLKDFAPQNDYLLILNLGGSTGVLHKKGVVINGRKAWAVKDWIDRRFMKAYQLSGEREEG